MAGRYTRAATLFVDADDLARAGAATLALARIEAGHQFDPDVVTELEEGVASGHIDLASTLAIASATPCARDRAGRRC